MALGLGMPGLIELPRVRDNVALCADLGLDFLEINMNLPACCPESIGASDLRMMCDDAGIGLTLHLPEEVDLASIHPPMREGHVRRCLEALEWGAEAGATLANLHINSGVYFTLPDRKVWIYERYQEEFLAALLGSFGTLYQAAGRLGVKLAIENAGDFARPHISAALERLSRFDEFRITWDIGHDASSGYSDRAILKRFDDRISHTHIHDYDGASNHQALGSGQVDVRAALAFAESRGIGAVIEVKTAEALRESIEWVRR